MINIPTDVLEAYAYANTPGFLLRKLLATEFVRDLSSLSAVELKHLVMEANPEDLRSIVLAYSGLVALLLRGDEAVGEVVKDSSLIWAHQIIAKFSQTSRTANILVVQPVVTYGRRPRIESTTTSQDIQRTAV